MLTALQVLSVLGCPRNCETCMGLRQQALHMYCCTTTLTGIEDLLLAESICESHLGQHGGHTDRQVGCIPASSLAGRPGNATGLFMKQPKQIAYISAEACGWLRHPCFERQTLQATAPAPAQQQQQRWLVFRPVLNKDPGAVD